MVTSPVVVGGALMAKTIYERIAAKIQAPKMPEAAMLHGVRDTHVFAPLGQIFDPLVCWEWIGAYSLKRHGSRRPNVQIDPRTHANPFRVLLCLRTGTTLASQANLHAAHNAGCDNSRCVNPFHGHWATHAENQAERAARHPESYLKKESR